MAPIKKKFGLTLIELVITTLIIGILSATALPLAKNFIRHEKELALKRNLLTLRNAIDKYYARKELSMPGLEYHEYYPISIEAMVEERILRSIPIDPFTQKADWKTRSSSDPLDSDISDGKNVFDVFSSSKEVSPRNDKYSSW